MMGKISIKDKTVEILTFYLQDNDLELDSAFSELLESGGGWMSINQSLEEILMSECFHLWNPAIIAIWCNGTENWNRDISFLIALIYHRYSLKSDLIDENLIWSITSNLKHVSYLSRYEPLKDPEVIKHFNKLSI